MSRSGDRKPIGDFGFFAKFVFGFVFGGIAAALLFFLCGQYLPDAWLASPSPKYFIGFVIIAAVVCGLASGFMTGGKWWKR